MRGIRLVKLRRGRRGRVKPSTTISDLRHEYLPSRQTICSGVLTLNSTDYTDNKSWVEQLPLLVSHRLGPQFARDSALRRPLGHNYGDG